MPAARIAKALLLPLLLLALWEAAARAGLLVAESVSHPAAIARAAFAMLGSGALFQSAYQTFACAVLGWLAGAGAGILAGLAFGLWPLLARLLRVSSEALRPIPSVALIPLALLIYGYGVRMESSIVAFSCFWPLLIMTETAVRGMEPRLLEVATMLRLTPAQRVMKIVLPAVLARVFVGLRLGAAIALVVAITVEISANPMGLGYALIVAQESMRADQVFALIGWISLMGFALNAALLAVQRRCFAPVPSGVRDDA